MGGPIERSNRDILEAQLAALEALLVSGTGLRYQMYGPTIMGVAGTGEFGATLMDVYGNVVADADVTPGTWTLRRSRGGTVTAIVTGTASQVVAGGVMAQYMFSGTDWAEGDVFYFEFNDVVVDEYEYPALYRMGSISAATVEGKVDSLLLDTAAIIAAVGVVDGKADDILTAVAALGNDDIAAVKAVVDAVKAKTDGLNFTGTDVKAVLATNGLTAAKFAVDAVNKLQRGLSRNRDTEALLGIGPELFVGGDWENGEQMTRGVYAGGTTALSTERAHSGTTSMKWVGGATGGFRISGFGSVCQGEVLSVEWWVYRAENGQMRTILRDSTASTAIVEYDNVLANTWTRIIRTFTIPADWSAVGFLLEFAATNAGTFYADDISVRRVADLSRGVQALTNAAINTAVANTPTAKSLRDILHKNSSGTYSRATDSLEAIRDRLEELYGATFSGSTDTLEAIRNRLDLLFGGTYDAATDSQEAIRNRMDQLAGATFSGSTDSLEALRDRMDLLPGDTYDAAVDALTMLSQYTRVARYLAGNLGDVNTSLPLLWSISGTAGVLESPMEGDTWPGLRGNEIAYPGATVFSKTFHGPIESGPVFVHVGTISGTGSVYVNIEIKTHDDEWRATSYWTSGAIAATTNNMALLQPPKIVIDGSYVKGMRYKVTAVGSPTMPTGSVRISANWRHRIKVFAI